MCIIFQIFEDYNFASEIISGRMKKEDKFLENCLKQSYKRSFKKYFCTVLKTLTSTSLSEGIPNTTKLLPDFLSDAPIHFRGTPLSDRPDCSNSSDSIYHWV